MIAHARELLDANLFLTLGTVGPDHGRALYAAELHGDDLDRGLRVYPGPATAAAPR